MRGELSTGTHCPTLFDYSIYTYAIRFHTAFLDRDIKGANILVGRYGEVKLADFGLAKHVCNFSFTSLSIPPMFVAFWFHYPIMHLSQ